MAAPTKQASRWGSFLQQAVAGVESRLDNMLADGDEAGKPNKLVGPSTTTVAATTKSESGTQARYRFFLQDQLLTASSQIYPELHRIAAEQTIDYRSASQGQ